MFWNDKMDEKQLKLIRSFYRIELYKLQKVLVKKKKKIETTRKKNCQHNWIYELGPSTGKSHYNCRLCGSYR
jgi:hypothetical protein